MPPRRRRIKLRPGRARRVWRLPGRDEQIGNAVTGEIDELDQTAGRGKRLVRESGITLVVQQRRFARSGDRDFRRAVAIEIGDGKAGHAERRASECETREAERAAGDARQNVDIAGGEQREIGDLIAIEIVNGDAEHRASNVISIEAAIERRPRARAENDGHRVRSRLRDGDVGFAIAVEVANRDADRRAVGVEIAAG